MWSSPQAKKQTNKQTNKQIIIICALSHFFHFPPSFSFFKEYWGRPRPCHESQIESVKIMVYAILFSVFPFMTVYS